MSLKKSLLTSVALLATFAPVVAPAIAHANTSSSTEAFKVGKQHPLYTKQQLTPVRRFYNSTTKTHRLVEDSTEIAKLQKSTKWRDEGVVFYTSYLFMDSVNDYYDDWTFSNQMRVGHFVFEMRHDATGRVLYTTNSTEMDALVKQGWTYNPDLAFVSGGDSFVYRLYNRSTKRHLFTMSEKERDNLVKSGWKYEGIAFSASSKSFYNALPNTNIIND